MNTTAKGNLLEDEIYRILLNLKESGVYGKYTKVFKHKKYFYGPTKTYKTIDVSIEQYLEEGDESPFITYVFECKNYKGKVNIAELEEFDTKLRGISERAIKGAMVTTIGFSEPSVSFAKCKQISLIKIVDGQLDYILKREIQDYSLYNRSISDLCNDNNTSCAFCDGSFLSLVDILNINGISINYDNLFKVPYIKNDEFKEQVSKFRKSFEILANDSIEETAHKCGLEIKYVDMKEGVLGKLHISSNSIYINSQLREDHKRAKFTIAHEIGHWYLHVPLLKDVIISFEDTNETIFVPNKSEQRMEIQANHFAAELLIPREIIKCELPYLLVKYGIRKMPLYIDNQKCNINNYHNIIGEFAHKHNLSKATVAYRLMDLKLLEMTPEAKFHLL